MINAEPCKPTMSSQVLWAATGGEYSKTITGDKPSKMLCTKKDRNIGKW